MSGPIDPAPVDVQQLLDRPSAPDEPPARALLVIAQYMEELVDEAMREHLREHHGLKFEREWRSTAQSHASG